MAAARGVSLDTMIEREGGVAYLFKPLQLDIKPPGSSDLAIIQLPKTSDGTPPAETRILATCISRFV